MPKAFVKSNENCPDCKATGFFCKLSESAKQDFEAMQFTSACQENTTLFRENEAARGIYVLCDGRAKISMSSSEGKTLILRIAQPGEILGLTDVLSGSPFGITVETLHACHVAFARREDFLRFLMQHPEAYSNVARELGSHYHQACEQLRTVGLSSSVSEKLARLFLDWSAGTPETKQGKKMNLPLTHEEIGEFIGTSRETVTRTLSDLKNRRLVILQGATLMIPDPGALANYAGI